MVKIDLKELEEKAKLERKTIVRRIGFYELIPMSDVGMVRKQK